jgi:sugar lactone lactonase YvrE
MPQPSSRRLVVALCAVCVASYKPLFAESVDEPLAIAPEWNGNIGYERFPEFFATDIDVDSSGNVYFTDVARGSVLRYSPDGEKQLEIRGIKKFVRGVNVDSVGRIYVGANLSRDILVYDASGNLVDTWVGVGNTSGLGTVSADDVIYLGMGRKVAAFDTDGNQILSFGSAGDGPGQFGLVSDVAVGRDGTIWVIDERLERLQKFDTTGRHLFTVGGPGEAPGLFDMPVSVDVDSAGNVYVSDRRNERVQKFSPHGAHLLSWGSMGTGPGQFLESHGLAVGPDDAVWVAGYHAYSVQAFAGDGTLLKFWQGDFRGPGQFTRVQGLNVNNGLLFATDMWRNRVQVFNAYTGKFLYDFGERGQGDATVFNFPRAIGMGPDGHVYVTDDGHTRRLTQTGEFVARYSFRGAIPTDENIVGGAGVVVGDSGILYQANRGRDTIFKIDTDSEELLLEFGESGENPKQLDEPAGIEFDENGDLVIAVKKNSGLRKYTPSGAFIGTFGPEIPVAWGIDRDPRSGKYVVGGWWKVRVLDSDGSLLYTIGTDGTGDGEFRGELPAVRLDEAGTLFVADKDNGRVQRFSRQLDISSEALAGKPSWMSGSRGGVLVWKTHFDGPYRVRVTGDGVPDRRKLRVLSDEAIFHVAPIQLEVNDYFAVGDNSLSADLQLSTADDGFDIAASPSATLMLAFSDRRDNAIVGAVEVGAGRVPLPLAGWIIEPSAFPTTEPAFTPGTHAGLYVSFDHDFSALHTKINGDGKPSKGSYHIVSDTLFATTVAENIEACCDKLEIGDWSLDFEGTYRTWWDAVSISFLTPPTMVGLSLVEKGMFAAHKVNPTELTDLGVPNAYMLPRLEPFGEPDIVPGTEGGLFIWKAEDGLWHLRVTAGEYGTARYEGFIESTSPIVSVTPRGLEHNDIHELIGGSTMRFNFRVADVWSDELAFEIPDGSGVTLTMTSGPEQDPATVVRVGAEKWPVLSSPLYLGAW